MIDIAFVGDVMLGRGVDRELRRMKPAQPWGDVLPLLADADLRIANLECALTTHATPWSRTPKVFHFRADPSTVEVLRAARIDACSLANNHTLDFGERGLIDTLETLDRAGIAHAGAGRNAAHAARPALVSGGHPPASIALIAFRWGPVSRARRAMPSTCVGRRLHRVDQGQASRARHPLS